MDFLHHSDKPLEVQFLRNLLLVDSNQFFLADFWFVVLCMQQAPCQGPQFPPRADVNMSTAVQWLPICSEAANGDMLKGPFAVSQRLCGCWKNEDSNPIFKDLGCDRKGFQYLKCAEWLC